MRLSIMQLVLRQKFPNFANHMMCLGLSTNGQILIFLGCCLYSGKEPVSAEKIKILKE